MTTLITITRHPRTPGGTGSDGYNYTALVRAVASRACADCGTFAPLGRWRIVPGVGGQYVCASHFAPDEPVTALRTLARTLP